MSAPFVMLPIPVEVAKDVAIAHGYDQVVVYAQRVADAYQPGGEHLTTYGRTAASSDAAARMGYHLRTELFGWQPSYAFSRAAVDVLDERHRQKAVEGWSEGHDDGHDRGELGRAAVAYAMEACIRSSCDAFRSWPWVRDWWKPSDKRRNLVKAAALLLAEIERLDRAAKRDEAQS